VTAHVELRCPVGFRTLFGKLKQAGEKPSIVEGNLLEFACHDCRRNLSRDDKVEVAYVFHRFDFVGDLIESVIRYRDGKEEIL